MQDSNGDTDIENRLMDMGRLEERVRCIETYIAICKIDSQWEFAVCLRELKQGLCNQLRGVEWRGRWEGGSRGRGYMYTYG